MKKIKLLLIAESGLAQQAYLAELYKLGADVDCIESPDELHDQLCDVPYNGLLVDVPTMIRSDSANKGRVTRIMERYPVLRLLYNSDHGGIRGLSQGGTVRANKSLDSFVLNECLTFPARSIRRARRSDLVLNVLLVDDRNRFGRDEERTVTVNVSEQGCFVYSVRAWEASAPAWMVVTELEDPSPIELKVHWTRRWGRSSRLPGIGTSYAHISDSQLEQIRYLL
ncbi:PilZ domain-containing protein [Salidesulfovibrio onnuriiensis]|uniref:PilZ domain-containing protein n=1 Tax=Salidesulfovibrio onnuriiensis TaxID=2583823 RepID=UPI00202AEFFE|nr:PilZ domain-containing protein [Salidesulfovibrio onnuriiensis]